MLTLKAARINKGLTQRELANDINVHVSTIVNWECGKTSPKMSDFEKLCQRLNVDKDSLIISSNQVKIEKGIR